jgi:hypothetical protein
VLNALFMISVLMYASCVETAGDDEQDIDEDEEGDEA